MAVQIQLRHDTAANWTAANPLLAVAEMGVETDTGKIKIGDGASSWNGLPYGLGTPNPASAVAAASLQAGQPVYINGITGQLQLASATNFASRFVAGLVTAATAAGFVANMTRDMLTLTNWSAVMGSSLLMPGQVYWLSSVPGMLLPASPQTAGQVSVVVGEAISSTQFLFRPGQPILL